ncbi:MAG TPA: hypothetical protein VNG53_01885 [Bacteroidia bacterium]|nr:hypothetical protein [Bacteroidia bacterium]
MEDKVVLKQKIVVKGKVKFTKDVKLKQNLTVDSNLTVGRNSTVQENLFLKSPSLLCYTGLLTLDASGAISPYPPPSPNPCLISSPFLKTIPKKKVF